MFTIQPILQLRLHFVHALQREVEIFKVADGWLRAVYSKAAVSLAESQLDPPMLKPAGKVPQILSEISNWPAAAAGKIKRLVRIELLMRLMVMVVTRSRMRKENLNRWEGGGQRWDWDAGCRGAHQDTRTGVK